MTEAIAEVQLSHLFDQVVNEIKVVTLEHCESVWDCFVKTVVSQAETEKTFLILDMFYISNRQIKGKSVYEWSPTSSLIEKCQLQCEQDNYSRSIVTNLTKQKMSRNLIKQQCLSSLGSPAQVGWSILQLIFKKIRQELNVENVQINLGFFGTFRVTDKLFNHIIKEDKNVRIKKLVTPRRSSSSIRITRRSSQNLALEDIVTTENASQEDSIMMNSYRKKQSPFSNFNKSINFANIVNRNQQLKTKQRSLLNAFSVPDTRISNDLLGAGIDPLKYDYNYSKLVNNTEKLFSKTFTKPKPAKTRHPGIIDKFERTTGVPQTGLKVSNSVVVRIGSNYNSYAKHIYCDIKAKGILFVPREPKITFTKDNKTKIQCATEQQQYRYVVTGDPSLRNKVSLRISNHERYAKYIDMYIQNSNVCPIENSSIKRIIDQVKNTIINCRSSQNISIMDRVMNEANRQYYRAYKKSMLDYILKDEKEKQRTSIHAIFKPPVQWGNRKTNLGSPLYQCKIDKTARTKVSKLLSDHLFHPKCVLEISNFNLKMKDLDLFRIKNPDNKPVNVLYFIKKQNTHIADVMTYLSSDWIKLVSDVVHKHVNFQEQPQAKIQTFLRLINVMLSNTLKNIVYQSFDRLLNFFKKFKKDSATFQPPILQISIIDENGKFALSDDFRKILTDEIRNLIMTILEQSKKIHGIEFYLTDQSNSYLWSRDKNEDHEIIVDQIAKIIDENCQQINQFKQQFQKYQVVLKYQQQTIQWLKTQRTLDQIDERNEQIQNMQDLVDTIPYCFINKMVLIECFDEKQKLKQYLSQLKNQIHQSLKSMVEKSNFKSFSEIEEIKRNISSSIENTTDYMKVSTDLDQIKKNKLIELQRQMEYNRKSLLKLLQLGYGHTYPDLMQKIFLTNKALRSLSSKLNYHEDRLNREKVQLQAKLKESIKAFETSTQTQLATISTRIDEFELRRVYNDYLVEMNNFKSIVDDNDLTVIELNKQQQHLKWPKTSFKAAEQLRNIVLPNYDLWILVLEYDIMTKEWKNKQICQMDVNVVKRRVQDINTRITKTIKKLKNLSSLKVAYELQKDTKDILSQHVQIIQIFSHPGLKQRHWQLFNTKLMIPGVDLKEIPYNKIKIFEQYEKNLKVLSVISSQAAKEFEIQNQRNEQQQYWASVSFETYSSAIENTFCISETFLDKCLAQLEEHSNKLSVMKNYLYSKALYQQLQQWQLWLASCKKNVDTLKKIQAQLILLRPLFSFEHIAKQLPIENSEFESIDNYWKTLTKKIWEHSKLFQFMKSPKISEMIEELIKKIQIVKRGVPLFLMTKRSEFPRFYFIDDNQLIGILVKAASALTQKQSIDLAFKQTFAPNLDLLQNDQKFISMKSQLTTLKLTSDVYQLKLKKKLSENLSFLEKCMRESVRNQVIQLLKINFFQNIAANTTKYCLTSIFCHFNILFNANVHQAISNKNLNGLIRQKQFCINKIIEAINQQQQNQSQIQVALKTVKLIKLQKIILSLMGEIQKIQMIISSNVSEIQSFQYQSMLKFVFRGQQKQNEPTQQIVQQDDTDKQIQKQLIQKFSSVCKTISNLRNHVSKENSILSNSKIQIESMGQQLEYREQFWGNQVHNYLPSFTQKTIFCMVNALVQNKGNSLYFQRSSSLARKLAIICGQRYTEISSEFFSDDHGFSCLLHGLAMSKTWFYVDCSRLKFCMKNYDKLNNLIVQIRQKKCESDIKNLKQTNSTYSKCLGQICQMNYSSACFLNFDSVVHFNQIPKSFRSQMRTVNLVLPPIAEYIKNMKEQFKVNQNFGRVSTKNIILEAVALYQKPEKVIQQISQIVKLKELQIEATHRMKVDLQTKFLQEKFDLRILDLNNQQLLNIFEPWQVCSLKPFTHKDSIQNNLLPHPLSSTAVANNTKQKLSFRDLHMKAKNQLLQAIGTSKLVIVYGSLDIKTELITSTVKQMKGYSRIQRSLYSFPACAVADTEQAVLKFMQINVTNLVEELNRALLRKSIKKELKQGTRQVYLHFQHFSHLQVHKIDLLLRAAESIERSGIVFPESMSQHSVSIRFIIDCLNIGQLSPSTVLRSSKVHLQIPENFSIGQFYNQWLLQNIRIDKQRSEDSRVNYESVMCNLRMLEPILENILGTALKALSVKLTRSAIHLKYILTLRFLRMYKIYIDHLDDKEVDQYVDYDVNSFIRNSFVYCVYWTICVGFLQPHEHFIVEQSLLKQHFPEITEIQEVSRYMLNEENQWLNWTSLKQQFTLTDIKNIPIYNVWVSTEQNMKIYTNVIKLLEKGLRVLVVGQKCSGKSILLKEISNFQMSYTSFLIDCHKLTKSDQVGQVIKNRIFYTKVDKKLILIDDINLPVQEVKISQMLKKIIEENILTCQFQNCAPRLQNRVLASNISALITCGSENKNQNEANGCLGLLQSAVQRLNIRSCQDADISTIYGAYINFELDKLKLKICEKNSDFEGHFSVFICKISKKFNLDFHTLNKIARLFLTTTNNIVVSGQKKEDTEIRKSMTLLDAMKILSFSVFNILGSRANLDLISSICLQETNKVLGAVHFKHIQQFISKINNENYNNLPVGLILPKSVSGEAYRNSHDKSVRERVDIVGSLIQELMIQKNENIQYIPTTMHTNLILKMSQILRIYPSHIMVVTQTAAPNQKTDNESRWLESGSFGLRTLTKIVSHVLSLNFNQIEQQNTNNFISESLNIIKAGGKIDESIYYLPRSELKSIQNSQQGKELISIVNSFISSPELFEFFTQQRIEQIFVKFSSEKKTLKRSEFIRKVREKVHLLFHFIIAVDSQGLNFLRQNYPSLVKECYVLTLNKFAEQCVYEIAARVIRPEHVKKSSDLSSSSCVSGSSRSLASMEEEKHRRSITNSLVHIYGKFEQFMKNRCSDVNSKELSNSIKYKMKNIFEYFKIFRSLRRKYQELNKKQEMNGEVWANRRKQTQTKYQQLLEEKAKMLQENEDYFKKAAVVTTRIQQCTSQISRLSEECRLLQMEQKVQKDNVKSHKHFSSSSVELHNWEQFIELSNIENQMHGFPHKQFEQLYNNQNFSKKMQIIIGNHQIVDLDFKTSILEGMEKIRFWRQNKIEYLMKQLVEQIQLDDERVEAQCQLELESLFILWGKSLLKLANKANDNETHIQGEEVKLASIEVKYQQKQKQLKAKQQQFSRLGEISQQFTQTSQLTIAFEQISKSINQIEPILNIFKHFEKVIKSTNKKSKSRQSEPVSLSKTLGCLIIAAAMIEFGFYLASSKQSDVDQFWMEAKEIVKANGLEVGQGNIFDNILNQEQIFKNKYKLIENGDAQTLCQIGLNFKTCSVLRVESHQVIIFYKWLQNTTERTVRIIQNTELSQVNQCMCNGYIGIIVNPNLQMVKKLKPLINNEGEIRNGTTYINITEQTILNPTTRIIFVFTTDYLSLVVTKLQILPCLSSLWHLNYPSVYSTLDEHRVHTQIKEMLLKSRSKRNQLIEQHLRLFQQLSKIDKKIQKMIMTIRKNNENPDRIIFKIESISQEKQTTIARMQEIVEQLQAIDSLSHPSAASKLKTHEGSSLASFEQAAEQQQIEQICKLAIKCLTVNSSKDLATTIDIEKWNMLCSYIEHVTRQYKFDLPKVKQKTIQYLNLFMSHLLSDESTRKNINSKQQSFGKFKRVDIEVLQQSEVSKFAEALQHAGEQDKQKRHQLWYSYLQAVLCLTPKHIANVKTDKNNQTLRVTIQPDNANSSIQAQTMSYTMPIPSNISNNTSYQNNNSNKNVLIYRTEHIDVVTKYFAGLLSDHGHQATIKDTSTLMDYNAKNIAFESLINIVQVRSSRDWKNVLQFIGSQFNQNTSNEQEHASIGKNQMSKYSHQGNQMQFSSRLIVVCEQSLPIPIHVQPRVVIGHLGDQLPQLCSVMQKTIAAVSKWDSTNQGTQLIFSQSSIIQAARVIVTTIRNQHQGETSSDNDQDVCESLIRALHDWTKSQQSSNVGFTQKYMKSLFLSIVAQQKTV